MATVIAESDNGEIRSPLVSVIVPALNEAGYIDRTLRSIEGAKDVEIIVADGGSTDDTAAIAESHGVHVLRCARGRAAQMNEAANHAQGEFLLFLHADTRMPASWACHVRDALACPEVTVGAFQFITDVDSVSMRLFAKLVNLRSRLLHMPYGDQGLFLRASTFKQLGGFPEIPIMEDFEMVRRLRRQGKVLIVPVPAAISGRRWLALGTWRTMWRNQLCILAYLLGVSPATISKWYDCAGGAL